MLGRAGREATGCTAPFMAGGDTATSLAACSANLAGLSGGGGCSRGFIPAAEAPRPRPRPRPFCFRWPEDAGSEACPTALTGMLCLAGGGSTRAASLRCEILSALVAFACLRELASLVCLGS